MWMLKWITKASLSETLTRVIGLKATGQISQSQFQQIDTLHYEVENKLLRLIGSVEKERDNGTGINRISDEREI
ncbi:hypothetical protein DRP98_03415 [candidate division KSB1 bacterium]|nr:MAG: hypothetical protein DRP98_03415 [candidate division KSB1 bacterium]